VTIDLTDKVALVCASSRGLGKASAFELAACGANVAICGRDMASLKSTEAELRSAAGTRGVHAIQADLSRFEDVERLVRETLSAFGRIDVLVVNSGGPRAGSFFDISKEDWDAAYRSVLYYVIALYQLVIPEMKARRWGRIVNITSLTVKQPVETLLLSNVFRSGVVSLAKTISSELIQFGITINNVCPGSFRTDRALDLMRARADRTGQTVEQIEEEAVASLPAKRFHAPGELASVVAFLASEQASAVTGATLQVDGGAYRGLF
jgi:3-oxoacyl-[acyl-carrier protein] reductase